MVEVTASYQITEKAKEHATVHIAFPRIQERWSYLLVKRLFDFFFALIGLIVLAIPMAIIALIIVFDSPGGAIFKQERLGKGGKPFVIYKFRTMNHDAEVNGPKWADKEDLREIKDVETVQLEDGYYADIMLSPYEAVYYYVNETESGQQLQ